MDLDTWISLAALLTASLAICGVTTSQVRQARAEAKADHRTAMASLTVFRAEIIAKIDGETATLRGDTRTLRDETRDLRDELVGRLTVLEQRTYDLASRLAPPSPERHTG